MTCPRCQRALEEIEGEGSRFGHCQQCGGVWFDFDDLDRVLESAQELAKERPAASGKLSPPERTPLRCPRCEGGLVRVSQDEYAYSACIVCYGRWVDGGDLPAGPRLSRRIRTLFRKFVEGGK